MGALVSHNIDRFIDKKLKVGDEHSENARNCRILLLDLKLKLCAIRNDSRFSPNTINTGIFCDYVVSYLENIQDRFESGWTDSTVCAAVRTDIEMVCELLLDQHRNMINAWERDQRNRQTHMHFICLPLVFALFVVLSLVMYLFKK